MKAKLAFISAHMSTYSIRLLCAVLGVARSWFHDWQAGDQARTAQSRVEGIVAWTPDASRLRHDREAAR